MAENPAQSTKNTKSEEGSGKPLKKDKVKLLGPAPHLRLNILETMGGYSWPTLGQNTNHDWVLLAKDKNTTKYSNIKYPFASELNYCKLILFQNRV